MIRFVFAMALVRLLVRVARGRWERRHRSRSGAVSVLDLAALSDLVVLGLVAGRSFPAALAAAGRYAPAQLADAVRRVERSARGQGAAAAYASAAGQLAPLLGLVAGAMSTGAPLAAAVASYGEQLREDHRVRAVTAARRLAVRLLFPLALLILPGFVLLLVGPVALDGLARLEL